MKTSKNRSEQFESKAHGAQRTRHTMSVGDERAPRNAAMRPNYPRPFGLPPNAAPASLRSSPREPPLALSRALQ